MKQIKKKALIFGITGQDGAILSSILLKKKYEVFGISRNKDYSKLVKLKINDKIKKIATIKNSIILNLLNKNFQEIYFLGGQSSVIKSFTDINQTYESQIKPINIILNFILNQKGKKSKFLYAASSEMFGQQNTKKKINENTSKNPLSPYGLSKLISFEIIKEYRNTHNLPVCSAILFNHESSLRQKDYIIKKIIDTARRIKFNKTNKLIIGNVNIKRDWGWAEDFMNACNLILRKNRIDDYVIATGKTVSLKTMLRLSFSSQGLNWKKYTRVNKKLIRKFDIKENYSDISKIKKVLGWKPKYFYKDIISKI